MGCKSLSFRWALFLIARIRCGWKPHLPGPDILVGAVSNCAYPVRLERDLYGSSIAVAIHSLDHSLWDLLSPSLSTRLIAPTGA